MQLFFQVLLAMTLLSTTAFGHVVTKTLDAAALQALVIDNSVGNITVTASRTKQVVITATRTHWSDDCELVIVPTAKQISVTVESHRSFFGLSENCIAHLDI